MTSVIRRACWPTAPTARRFYSAYVPLPDALKYGETIRYPHRGRAHLLQADASRPGKSFAIAIIGASGSIGRQTAMSLVAKRKQFTGLGPMTVQFVGQRGDHSLATLIGLCSELRDAYEDHCPHLEVSIDMDAVNADIIIYEAGAGLSKQFMTHTDLARANAEMFGIHAEKLFMRNKHSIVLIVSNPVEFGVDTFVKVGFRQQQVLGIGPFLESLRFRREIASEIGIPRQYVSGLVLGAQGLAMVPCWSTVQLATVMRGENVELLEKLKCEGLGRMPYDVPAIRELAYKVRDLALDGQTLAAAALINKQSPDIRAIVRRYMSFFSGPYYPRVGIAEAVVDLICIILSGRDTISAGTVRCEHGKFLGISGHALGAPVILSSKGFELAPIDLLPVEEESVRASAREIESLNQTAHAKRLFTWIKKRARDTKD